MALQSQTQRSLLLGFIVSIVVCGLVGIYCLLRGRLGPTEERILGTSAVVGAASILMLANAIPWELRRWHPLGPLAGLAVVIATFMVLLAIWTQPGSLGDRYYRAMGIAIVLGVTLSHLGLISLARLRADFEWVRHVTVLVMSLLAAQLISTILFEISDDGWVRAIGVTIILDVCGTIAVPVLHRVSGIDKRAAVTTVDLCISLTCPRCETTQTMPVGRGKCGHCGLRFLIEIEEEHCPACGYALYKLESTRCPECGANVLPDPPA